MSSDLVQSVIQQLRRAALLPDAGGMSDGQLLECFVAQRDEAAFEVLVRRHGPMVLGVCQRVLHDPNDAADAFQATFLVLVRKAATLRSRELLGNWLYGVAHRTAMKARAMTVKRRKMERHASESKKSLASSQDCRPEGLDLLSSSTRHWQPYKRTPVNRHRRVPRPIRRRRSNRKIGGQRQVSLARTTTFKVCAKRYGLLCSEQRTNKTREEAGFPLGQSRGEGKGVLSAVLEVEQVGPGAAALAAREDEAAEPQVDKADEAATAVELVADEAATAVELVAARADEAAAVASEPVRVAMSDGRVRAVVARRACICRATGSCLA